MSGLPNKSVCQHDVQAESAAGRLGITQKVAWRLYRVRMLPYRVRLVLLNWAIIGTKYSVKKAWYGKGRSGQITDADYINATTASFQPVSRKND